MTEKPVLLNISKGVGVITLNRPEKLNAFTNALHTELRTVLQQCADDDTVRAILITGAGRAFCAGQDLNERKNLKIEELDLGEKIEQFYNPLIKLMRAIPKPIVAGVNGVAAGAGASLALACDIIVAGEDTKFIQAFSKIALVPDSGATWFLPKYIGEPRAKYLAFTGEPILAKQAYDMGLISKVVATGETVNEATALAENLAKGPTTAYALTKQAMQSASENTLNTQLDLERDLQRLAGKTTDYMEGVTAFKEKRPPQFKGK